MATRIVSLVILLACTSQAARMEIKEVLAVDGDVDNVLNEADAEEDGASAHMTSSAAATVGDTKTQPTLNDTTLAVNGDSEQNTLDEDQDLIGSSSRHANKLMLTNFLGYITCVGPELKRSLKWNRIGRGRAYRFDGVKAFRAYFQKFRVASEAAGDELIIEDPADRFSKVQERNLIRVYDYLLSDGMKAWFTTDADKTQIFVEAKPTGNWEAITWANTLKKADANGTSYAWLADCGGGAKLKLRASGATKAQQKAMIALLTPKLEIKVGDRCADKCSAAMQILATSKATMWIGFTGPPAIQQRREYKNQMAKILTGPFEEEIKEKLAFEALEQTEEARLEFQAAKKHMKIKGDNGNIAMLSVGSTTTQFYATGAGGKNVLVNGGAKKLLKELNEGEFDEYVKALTN